MGPLPFFQMHRFTPLCTVSIVTGMFWVVPVEVVTMEDIITDKFLGLRDNHQHATVHC